MISSDLVSEITLFLPAPFIYKPFFYGWGYPC